MIVRLQAHFDEKSLSGLLDLKSIPKPKFKVFAFSFPESLNVKLANESLNLPFTPGNKLNAFFFSSPMVNFSNSSLDDATDNTLIECLLILIRTWKAILALFNENRSRCKAQNKEIYCAPFSFTFNRKKITALTFVLIPQTLLFWSKPQQQVLLRHNTGQQPHGQRSDTLREPSS